MKDYVKDRVFEVAKEMGVSANDLVNSVLIDFFKTKNKGTDTNILEKLDDLQKIWEIGRMLSLNGIYNRNAREKVKQEFTKHDGASLKQKELILKSFGVREIIAKQLENDYDKLLREYCIKYGIEEIFNDEEGKKYLELKTINPNIKPAVSINDYYELTEITVKVTGIILNSEINIGFDCEIIKIDGEVRENKNTPEWTPKLGFKGSIILSEVESNKIKYLVGKTINDWIGKEFSYLKTNDVGSTITGWHWQLVAINGDRKIVEEALPPQTYKRNMAVI